MYLISGHLCVRLGVVGSFRLRKYIVPQVVNLLKAPSFATPCACWSARSPRPPGSSWARIPVQSEIYSVQISLRVFQDFSSLWFPIGAVWDLQCTDFTAAFLNFFHTTPLGMSVPALLVFPCNPNGFSTVCPIVVPWQRSLHF